MTAAPVIPVLVIERAEDAVPVAEALVAGGLPAIRTDIPEGGLDAKALEKMASGNLKPIRINDSLLEYMDQRKRADFFRKWNQTMGRRS